MRNKAKNRFSSDKLKKDLIEAGVNLLLLLIILFSIVPIYWMIATSFKTELQMISIPPVIFFKPTMANYTNLLSKSKWLLHNLMNSISITVATSFLTLFLGSLAGFAFSRHNFHGERFLTFLILWTRTLPPIVAIVPLFLWFSKIGLVDTHFGLIFIYTALNLPFAIWMLKSYFDSVPVELEEAAIIDGCSRLGAFRRVTIRLAAPGMAATAIFVAVLAWNEFLFALIFTSVDAKTMPIVVVESIVEYKLYWADMAALGTIVMFPILIFSFFVYRHLVSGLTFGSIK